MPGSIGQVGSKRRLQLLIDAIVDYAVFLMEVDGTIATWNPGAQRIKGYTADEIVGRNFEVFYTAPDRRAGLPGRGLATARDKGRFENEGWRVRKDGSLFWASVVIDAVRDESGDIIGFAKVTRDVTRRREAEEALHQSEQRFRLFVQSVRDYALVMLDAGGHVISWNTGAERMKGYPTREILGSHVARFFTEEDRAAGRPQLALQTAIREGHYEEEAWRLRKDGTRFWANVVIDPIRDERGELVGFAKVIRDITERRHAQEELERTRGVLLQAQKMEAVGQLTGGIAHDFNNLLTVIGGNLELALQSADDPARVRTRVEAAMRAADRGARLTQQLLAFGRRQPMNPLPADVHAIIHEFLSVLSQACGELIEIRTDFAPTLWPAQLDRTHFETALLNLAVNARDAMPGGGTLRIATRNRTVERGAVGELAAGAYVEIEVADTGIGMTPEVLARACEPFFTTKEVGKGSGLGLSQVYGSLRQLGGGMMIASEPGRGTAVKLYMPRAEAPQPREAVSPRPVGDEPVQGRTVLVVEDDAEVRAVTIEMLRELGLDVVAADDGPQALALLDQKRDIDALVTDVMMPNGMSGVELAREAMRRRPSLRVLLTSGYDPKLLAESRAPALELLIKPFRRAELAAKMRELLG